MRISQAIVSVAPEQPRREVSAQTRGRSAWEVRLEEKYGIAPADSATSDELQRSNSNHAQQRTYADPLYAAISEPPTAGSDNVVTPPEKTRKRLRLLKVLLCGTYPPATK